MASQSRPRRWAVGAVGRCDAGTVARVTTVAIRRARLLRAVNLPECAPDGASAPLRRPAPPPPLASVTPAAPLRHPGSHPLRSAPPPLHSAERAGQAYFENPPTKIRRGK